jgi:hypothetical protein
MGPRHPCRQQYQLNLFFPRRANLSEEKDSVQPLGKIVPYSLDPVQVPEYTCRDATSEGGWPSGRGLSKLRGIKRHPRYCLTHSSDNVARFCTNHDTLLTNCVCFLPGLLRL